MGFGAIEGNTGGGRMEAVGIFGEEAEQASIGIVLLELGLF